VVARDGILQHYANLAVPLVGLELIPNMEVRHNI
jgi:hypothetical protein